MAIQKDAVIKQIDTALKNYQELSSRSAYDDCSDLPHADTTALITSLCATIRRLSPPSSQYLKSMDSIIKDSKIDNAYIVPHLVGVLNALRGDYTKGYLSTIAELLHADIFADFLERADYLLSEGYKDPAAVIAGSVLEEHLSQLCIKNSIPLLIGTKPKKADLLNSELAALPSYSVLDQKSVTAWLDLRNKAAHGKYSEYTKEQVSLMIQGIRDFMARIPA